MCAPFSTCRELSKRAISRSTPTLNLDLLNFEPAVILQRLERSEAVERLERFELSGGQLSEYYVELLNLEH
jgi:hypothetical protein